MCGIFGFIEKTANSIDNKEAVLKSSTDLMHHRGPDGEAYFLDKTCGLGMQRLAIRDLTPDLYPFTNIDGSKQLVFNGEIYNYSSLKKELEILGYDFKSTCDAEAIMYGFEEWGIEVLKKLRGMFAIAIWDIKKEELFLARDRIGIKPVYFINDPKYFFFSSEVKPFLSSDFKYIDKKLDPKMVHSLLGFMFLPYSDKTLIKGVKKLPPASYMKVTKTETKTERYWNIRDVSQNNVITFEQATDKLDDLLQEVISQHLLADVPLGMLLSGGLDSGLLAAIIVKNGLQSSLNTYTAKFDHKFNESDLAKKTADYIGTNHTELLINTKDINANIEDHIHLLDDLTTFDGGIFSTKILCNEIEKKGIKVLLLGEGADEVFGGYSWFGLSQFPFNIMPPFIRNSIYYYVLSRNINVDIFKYIKFWNSVQKNTLDSFRDITHRELEVQLPNHLLMKVDKGTMSASIEARVPYLDHKIVEFSYSLPRKYKLKGAFPNLSQANEKYILREVARRYLPEEVVTRKKKGFFLPMNDVLQADIAKVKSYVLAENSISSEIFTRKRLESFFKAPPNNLIAMQNEYFLWRLFLLEVWALKNNLSL